MPKSTVTIKSTRPLRTAAHGALRTLTGELAVLQLEQVTRAFRESGQPSRKWVPLSDGGRGYRRGGKPLVDNGLLRASFFMMTPRVTKRTLSVSIRSSSHYAPYHQYGWTADPAKIYFIPLTLVARRSHRTGADPEDEGLIASQIQKLSPHL